MCAVVVGACVCKRVGGVERRGGSQRKCGSRIIVCRVTRKARQLAGGNRSVQSETHTLETRNRPKFQSGLGYA
jgi:hypothetical protein